MSADIVAIHWQAPWLARYATLGQQAAQQVLAAPRWRTPSMA